MNADLEETVAKYIGWLSEIIEEPIRPEDRFLDVGGNSMIAIALNARLKESKSVEVDLLSLFTLPIEKAVQKALINK